ncbi:MAG: radical SAM protein [Candidatus Lokiarchaeota archaeon]|nr:radical SAM protein [Candidatus Lokiarchaeota archaeon]MBD3200966.1 radical SAM protein [Candidatus Lokiarchaeota archaeon]
MRICLINPAPIKVGKSENETLFYASSPPLGLIYIATYLNNSGHKIIILDQAAMYLTNEDIVKKVKTFDPDIIGFSVLNASLDNAKIISKKLKEWNPNLIIIFGNYPATFYPNRILETYDWVDICVRGEGEKTFKEIVDSMEKQGDLSNIRGITYRKNDNIYHNEIRNNIEDLDSLPHPNRDLVLDVYKNRIGGIDVSNRKFTTIVSSRGCPYSCNFCGCTSFSNGKWRTRSVDNILDEILLLADDGYEEILFVDDNFTLSKKRILSLCKAIRKEKLDIVFTCDGRVNNSSLSLLRSLHKTNFKMIMFGIESASQRMLNYYNKRITPNMSEKAVENARKAGFEFIIGSFMIGGLDESYSEAIKTLNLISRLDIDFPYIIFPRALPGTPLFKNLVESEIISEDKYWETGVDLIDLPEAIMNRDIIYKMIKEQFRIKFFRPSYLLKAFYRTLVNKYRREIIFNHLSFKDFDQFIKIINNPPNLF